MPRFSACNPGMPQKCVSSLDDEGYPAMEPLAFTCSPEEAFATVRAAVAAYPRTTITEEDDRYVDAICRTKLLRFKDRVQFEVDDEAKVVHFKSNSTLGFAVDDMGANRTRIKELLATIAENLPAG